MNSTRNHVLGVTACLFLRVVSCRPSQMTEHKIPGFILKHEYAVDSVTLINGDTEFNYVLANVLLLKPSVF